MIISRTPFRVSFFGGGTDYPAHFVDHGGAVLATTIDKHCYITCRYLPPFFRHKSRIAYSKIELVGDLEQIEHPAVREVLRFMRITEGVEIHHDADLPARTGLGSSSSFTVGLLHALYALRQSMPTKNQLAREAIRIERDVLKENVGSQDQASAAYGGFNKIVFNPDHTLTLAPVILPQERLSRFQDHLMLYFTGFSRTASEIAKEQVENTAAKKAELLRMRRMVDEAVDILSGSGDLGDFGRLLHESWTLKRGLSSRISTPLIDEIYETARSSGALGGKLLGAGGGGFVLLFARPEEQPAIKKRLSKLLLVPFRFESAGSHIIFYDHATATRNDLDGPGRLAAGPERGPVVIPAK